MPITRSFDIGTGKYKKLILGKKALFGSPGKANP
jgi:hypothetical protein